MTWDLKLYKGALLQQGGWNILDHPLAIPYFDLQKNNKEKVITLQAAFKEDAQKMIDTAKEVLRDHSKANELMPKGLSYELLKGEATYDKAYFEEVQEILERLEHAYKNTAWDNHEIWFFYEVPDKK